MQVKCCGSCEHFYQDTKHINFRCRLDEETPVIDRKLYEPPCEKYKEYEDSHEFIVEECFNFYHS